jgi:hypothetical protein
MTVVLDRRGARPMQLEERVETEEVVLVDADDRQTGTAGKAARVRKWYPLTGLERSHLVRDHSPKVQSIPLSQCQES